MIVDSPTVRRTCIGSLIAAGLALAGVLGASAPALAAGTLAVTTTDDEYNTGAGCSLREAITTISNTQDFGGCTYGGAATIALVPGATYMLTRTGAGEDFNATGDLDVRATMTITAAGLATIAAGPGFVDRIVHIVQPAGSPRVHLTNIAIQGGSAGFGGGLYNLESLTLTRVIVYNNVASFSGGGLSNGSAATLTMVDSLVYSNTAPIGGGLDTFSASTTALTNTTISGNAASDGGGGINVGGSLSLNNVTVAGNQATGFSGGGGLLVGTTVLFANTLIAGNSGSPGPDCAATGDFVSQGYNLIGDTTDCAITGTLGTVITNTAALIGPLQFNSSWIQTHALLAGSPAIGAGNPLTPTGTNNTCQPTDQRGYSRAVALFCDIGAHEAITLTAVFLPSIVR